MNVDISPIKQLARHASEHGDMVVAVYEDRRVSYAEFHREVGLLAAALKDDGIGRGDRVAYAGHNSLNFVITYFAAAWVGAVFLPLNFRLAGPEIRTVLEDARPDVLIAEPEQASKIGAFLELLSVRQPLLIDDDPNILDPAPEFGDWASYREFRTAHTALEPHVPQHEEDLAALLYTSGTTGRSKGVMLTHGNLWWGQANVDSVLDTRFGDVSLAVAPLFHIGGFNAFTLRTVTRGGTLVIRRQFDPAQALADLEEFRVNSMFLVPAMLSAISRQEGFEDADLSELRAATVAGAPVPPALIEQYAQKNVLLLQAWGLTETAPFSTQLEAAMTAEKLGSCGVPMPYSEVKIVDPESLADVAEPCVTGEMWVRGPNVSAGYWNNPEATAAAFTPDGWFRTGDLGYFDEDGYFFIVDRLKDMIISGGENIYPAEIEIALNAHPAVTDVAVIGTPHEKWGETVCAVVAFAPGEELDLEALRDFLTKRIARYKLPSRLVTVDAVPRNGAGKLDKVLIREQVAASDNAQTAPAVPPYTEAVRIPR
ncbi:long-chain fatty acid--CoA ligase [Leucobacter sp. CSA2]|uniref:Long-chain fatty acid--CoA ligase n=1 Tax=Leucobacter edaphi TaxID=2796472 RepID=A0A934UXH3_9MICO|nr:long-chain fatty acid--CoA ligase [Leucobacter edaphi]MBK0422015.1 long-chain fatty acid--CoA ligase [Leucobacter edaphi]